MPEQALVTVICLCYNHERFVEKAIMSVISQTYQNTEIILVDDGSRDNSPAKIKQLAIQFPDIQTLILPQNIGNCKAFNKALALAKGKYVIDFATDDILLPERITEQVTLFETLPETYGVVFGNSQFISEQGQLLHTHYKIDSTGKAAAEVPSGDIYKDIFLKYFISTPTMMMRKTVLEKLNGYDESLSYEDFDFWVRSSRNWFYYYQDRVLTQKRIVAGSLSTQFYKKGQNKLLASTLIVCEKALILNRNKEENEALAICIRYHLRQSFFIEDYALVNKYALLLKKTSNTDSLSQLFVFLAKLRIPVFTVYRLYKRLQ